MAENLSQELERMRLERRIAAERVPSLEAAVRWLHEHRSAYGPVPPEIQETLKSLGLGPSKRGGKDADGP